MGSIISRTRYKGFYYIRRKTTIEERKEIVEYCINMDLIIKKLQVFMTYPIAKFIRGLKSIIMTVYMA